MTQSIPRTNYKAVHHQRYGPDRVLRRPARALSISDRLRAQRGRHYDRRVQVGISHARAIVEESVA
jgi:hypothetical protein